ncbi:NADPH oxidase organizer 1-like [Polymixia lowei]
MVDPQRYVTGCRVIGVMHREMGDAPKVTMFLISVLWSDGGEVIIYRTFHDFKKFHKQLKKKFHPLNALQTRDRMIPMRALKSSLQQKGSCRSVRRMRFLEEYCTELMMCDPTVTQSSEVTQFFMPKDHDVQPDFTKNSIMILPSNDLPKESRGKRGGVTSQQRRGCVSQPLLTQMYRCVAPYETKDTKNQPLKVALDEKLDVLIKDPAGWWLVENEDKRLAWFPAPYLEMCDKEEEEEDDEEEAEEEDELDGILGGALYCAVRNYVTKKHDEVPLSIGAVVEVLRKTNDGWWLIRYNGKAGYFPSMYLQPYNNPQVGLHSLQKRLSCSTEKRSCSSAAPGLPKAQPLDILSEPVFPGQGTGDISISSSCKSSVNTTSTESSFSSGSESSSSVKERLRRRPDSLTSSLLSSDSGCSSPHLSLSGCSSIGSDDFGFVKPNGNEVAPTVPPRPQVQEILSRCTTMTRKAAMACKARLLC